MKLIHKEDEKTPFINNDEYEEFHIINDELRNAEFKFYELFDFNPCPMSIHDINTGFIIDVNQSFLDTMDIRSKKDIIGKNVNTINETDRKNFLNELLKNGFVKSKVISFRNTSNKKIKALFSGTIIDLNNKKCFLIICQVINKQCIINTILCK